MDIVLTLVVGSDGRLTGTARTDTAGQAVSFSGNLELLAALERLWSEGQQREAAGI